MDIKLRPITSKEQYDTIIKNIRSELKSYIQKSKLKSLVLGISGGINSILY